MESVIVSMLQEYDRSRELNAAFTSKLESTIRSVLQARGVNVGSITSRVKERDKLREKVEKSPDKYKTLSDVTDVCGVRVITDFSDQVDMVGGIIEHEFDIDYRNSVDKRNLLDPDRFGYLSLHYVVKLKRNRLRLGEYKSFSTCKAEVQIRSMLQHAWAEIEHDLGYKQKQSVPPHIRRRFSQLAGLLELADKQFERTRDDTATYRESLPTLIERHPDLVVLDKSSLTVYVQISGLVARMDRDITTSLGATCLVYEDWLANLVPILNHAGFNTVSDINSSMAKSEHLLHDLLGILLSIKCSRPEGVVPAGMCLLHLAMLEASRSQKTKVLSAFLKTSGLSSPESGDSDAAKLVKAVRTASAKVGARAS